MSGLSSRTRWEVRASHIAKKTHNPIRSIVDNIVVEPNPSKRMIALSIGDPTTFGNLKPAKEVIEAVQESVTSQMNNGYAPSTGYEKAREAVAEYSSTDFVKVEAKDHSFLSCTSQIVKFNNSLSKENNVDIWKEILHHYLVPKWLKYSLGSLWVASGHVYEDFSIILVEKEARCPSIESILTF
ncbi:hypothetical protein M0802_015205 [Mischocyttarus mexicanus]|nr:hypothetical protein M0802_015205 [Mischocyttarus mexicanus]